MFCLRLFAIDQNHFSLYFMWVHSHKLLLYERDGTWNNGNSYVVFHYSTGYYVYVCICSTFFILRTIYNMLHHWLTVTAGYSEILTLLILVLPETQFKLKFQKIPLLPKLNLSHASSSCNQFASFIQGST